MLKKILETIGTRYLIALLNLALIFMNAKALGVAGVGLVGLIVASVNIAVIFNSIFCGNTIVYFMNRYPIRLVFFPAYGWTLVGSAFACGLLKVTGMLPAGYGADVYGLAVLNSVVAANARFLLGKDRIGGFNLTFLLQGGLLFFVLLFLYYGIGKPGISAYLHGLYVTNGIAFCVSLFLLIPYLTERQRLPGGGKGSVGNGSSVSLANVSFFSLLKEMFTYGLWSGADNLAEVCTTRLNYFLIRRFGGLSSVGLLDGGTKIAESVWHISRSVSFIEYSSVAKTVDRGEQKIITLQLFKLTFCATCLAMGVILSIPERVYTDYLFTPEFKGIRRVIVGLAPGIVALGCNSILSHYFIGSGKIRFSTISSCVGLVTLPAAGYFLIPAYGVTGSAVSTSIAFMAMLAFSLVLFSRQTKAGFFEFIPNRRDWEVLKRRWLVFRRKG